VTAVAVLAVGCALAASAGAVQVVLNNDRHNVLMTTAQIQAREFAALNTNSQRILGGSLNVGQIQVVGDRGRVLAASKDLRNQPALWAPNDPTIQAPDSAAFVARDVRFVAVPERIGSEQLTVVVVVSMYQYDRSVQSVHSILEIGLPILLLVVGLIIWWIVGRALRPIDALRREVDDVATRPGERRVAEPLTDDEVGRLARTLNSMLDRLEQASSRERRFVADASHELRSPIANIRTALEVALHRPNVADWPKVAAEVLDQDSRMGHLVEQLLLLARSDEGFLLPAAGASDLAEVTQNVVSSLPPVPRPVAVVVDGPNVDVPVPAVYLERIVTNLVDNARRYARSRVDVTIRRHRHVAVLTVHDDGPGIAPEDRARIFERFVRLDEARDREHGGFGLGLAIVADLCRAYGGTISVTDTGPGAGAAFSVEFPIAKPRARRPAPEMAAPGV
jgi:signal transduction histidine kinase